MVPVHLPETQHPMCNASSLLFLTVIQLHSQETEVQQIHTDRLFKVRQARSKQIKVSCFSEC